MRKRKKTISIALAVVLALLAFTARLDVVYGADEMIDPTRENCSITFDLDFDELLNYKIDIAIYKVADVTRDGTYAAPTKADAASDLYAVLGTTLDTVSSKTLAGEWMEMAETARDAIGEDTNTAGTAAFNDPDSEDEDGATISGLSTGLYLVAAGDVESDQYIYTFAPFLVSLPGNEYKGPGTSDKWKYDVTVSLKPGQVKRYGDLEIIKNLLSYNATLGSTACIFQIEAVKDEAVCYSDVVSINFNSAKSDSVKIEGKIPVGAEVTVTEVYSGASYTVTPPAEETVTIDAEETATVEFTNKYDERLNGGTSIVNTFINKTDQTGGNKGAEGQEGQTEGTTATKTIWEYQKPQETGGREDEK